MPMSSLNFQRQFFQWIRSTKEGIFAAREIKIGIVNKKIVYSEFEARTFISYQDNRKTKMPFYEKWEQFIEEQRAKAPL